MAERAAAFGMRIGCLHRAGRSQATRDRLAELDAVVLRRRCPSCSPPSDVVSLHVPASPETKNLVDADFLAAMKPGAILVNTSRGDVVDEAALLAALDAGRVRAGLDVFADEPGSGTAEWDSPLARHPQVVATHHIGASTAQAQAAIAAGVVEIVDAFAAGEARNCVNLAPRGLGSATLTVRHVDKVGVLARVLELLREAGLNVEHMQNRIFAGGAAAVATIDVAGTVPADLPPPRRDPRGAGHLARRHRPTGGARVIRACASRAAPCRKPSTPRRRPALRRLVGPRRGRRRPGGHGVGGFGRRALGAALGAPRRLRADATGAVRLPAEHAARASTPASSATSRPRRSSTAGCWATSRCSPNASTGSRATSPPCRSTWSW